MQSPNSTSPTRLTLPLIAILLVITAFGAAIRCHKITVPPFSQWELHTIRDTGQLSDLRLPKVLGYVPTALVHHFSGIDLNAIVTKDTDDWTSHRDAHEWKRLGVTHGITRAASVSFGIVTIFFVGLASVRMLGRGPALIAALLLATALWHVEWSQEARYYTQQFLFYTLALVLYYVGTRDRSPMHVASAALCLVIAFLSQPPALILAAVFAIDWFIGFLRKERVSLTGPGWASMIIGGAFAAGLVIHNVLRPDDGGWDKFLTFAGDTYGTPGAVAFDSLYAVGPLVVLLAGCTCARLLLKRDRLTIYLTIGAILPIVLYALWSIGNQIHFRYCFIALWPWLALSALGLHSIYLAARPSVGQILAISPVLILVLDSLHRLYIYFEPGYQHRPRWIEAAEHLAVNRSPEEPVFTRGVELNFYLEEEFDQLLPVNDAVDRIKAAGRTVWIVVPDYGHMTAVHRWMQEHAELQLVLSSRIPRPYHSLTIYRYDGSSMDD